MNNDFWRNKRVFITGHTGFKGSWLSIWLEQLGAIVTGYALAPESSPCLFDIARVGEGMTSVLGDILDRNVLVQAVKKAEPEIVLHLAAQSLVRRSYAEPADTFAVNVMGTANLLEAVRGCPSVRSVLLVTTDKCYENREWVWGYREQDALGGHDPYSSSKACAEFVVAAYRSSFFSPALYEAHHVGVATARAGNVLGGGDWAADRLVPDTLRAFAESRPVELRNPSSIRPWQHVLEPIGGYLLLAERLYDDGRIYSEAWNFGPDDDGDRTVEWVVGQLAQSWGDGAAWLTLSGDEPHEARLLRLDCSKARSQLGWRPRWSLDQALDRTITWQKSYLAGHDMREICIRQIAEYVESEVQAE